MAVYAAAFDRDGLHLARVLESHQEASAPSWCHTVRGVAGKHRAGTAPLGRMKQPILWQNGPVTGIIAPQYMGLLVLYISEKPCQKVNLLEAHFCCGEKKGITRRDKPVCKRDDVFCARHKAAVLLHGPGNQPPVVFCQSQIATLQAMCIFYLKITCCLTTCYLTSV